MIDFCKFFKDIEKDPSAITPQLTVGQFLQARAHIATCDACDAIVDKVVGKSPPRTGPTTTLN
jgi:hypothetical protein